MLLSDWELKAAHSIVGIVCDYYTVEEDLVLNTTIRHRQVTHARKIAIYLIREIMKLSWHKIQEVFGFKKSHSPAINAHKRVSLFLQKNKALRKSIKTLSDECKEFAVVRELHYGEGEGK